MCDEHDIGEMAAKALVDSIMGWSSATVQESSGSNNGPEAGDIVDNKPPADVPTMLSDPSSMSGESTGDGDSTSGESADDSNSTYEEMADDTDNSSVANPTVAVADTTLESTQVVLPTDLSRRSVIRYGLLRQGFLEPNTSAYFLQFSKKTNRNTMWGYWVYWCEARGMDPLITSDVDLNTFISGIKWPEARKKRTKSQVKLIWSIVEGHPPPSKLLPRKNQASN
ncbi:hypothetical protein GGH13_001299 [Coemansia sp. S155-1]|nr:hypothetical protein GGH13_001299 [Coemansia sp. S155-1]